MKFNIVTLRSISALSFLALAQTSLAQTASDQNVQLNKETDQKVQTIYETLYAGICRSLMEGNTPHQPTIYEFGFNYGDENYPERPFRLYEYLCFEGPYNQSSVFFGANDYQDIQHLTFSVPTFEIAYETEGDYTAVQSIKTTGFSAKDQIINAQFNQASLTLSSFAKWRGPADAFSIGVWEFIDSEFVLQTYEVDAAYDGERKPILIYTDTPTKYENKEESQ